MPTYGTKVPCEEHICALPEAIIQKGKERALILRTEAILSNVCKIGKKRKEDKSHKIRLASFVFFTSRFLFSRCRRNTSRCSHP